MIPKIIHYCWVGNSPKPESVLFCIESWKKYCPDYEIIEWNESNYDFTKNTYMKQAYEAKKWGFVPDYARLDIVYQYGGIYLDTDVEMIRNFDELLTNQGFFGFEDTGEGDYFVACGLGFGAEKGNPLVKKLRDYYDGISFVNEDASLNLMPAPRHNALIFNKEGVIMNNSLQVIEGNVFYPAEYFCPKIFKTGKTKLTEHTLSIHHFSASWMDELIVKEINHNQKICMRFGDKLGRRLLLVESIWKKYGVIGSVKRCAVKIYELLYQYIPVVTGLFKHTIIKKSNSNNVVLFDTSLETQNMGDHIIMENCMKHLENLIDVHNATHISTHVLSQNAEECKGKYKILCGTNILSCRMMHYGLWKLPRHLEWYSDTVLMGVGFDSYNTKSDLYTRLLLKLILSKNNVHSVRDSFSEIALKNMGINNVLNTGCPTMWNLTPEHCKHIPTQKANRVVCTVTDYNRDIANDKAMLDILLKEYDTVYLWLQGQDDLKYIQEMGYADKVNLIESTLKGYDDILKEDDLDYVGTRLHAGIRALKAGHRSLIISIDNRAECIHSDTGLPIIKREEVPVALKERINGNIQIIITLPWENIRKWKEQFVKIGERHEKSF